MESTLQKDYLVDLQRIKETIRENANKAMVIVNSAMIITYYQIGTIINERKSWGNKFVQRLAIDLKEYGKGYSFDNLNKMSRFARICFDDQILLQAATKIAWWTIVTIMGKASSKEETLWYINQTYKNRWSRSMVSKQFELQAYERNLTTPMTSIDGVVQDITKETLLLDFISKDDVQNEKDLKDRMVDNIIKFLQELGPGFSLVGKEYKLITPTNKEFYIDILMYHTKIHAYIVIEIKIGEFSPSDLGKLIFYVNAIDDLERTDKDDETIGLLLCKDSDTYVAKTSLNNNQMKLGISKYKIIKELPEYLEKRLKEKS